MFFVARLRQIGHDADGRSKISKTCLPVHISTGLRIAGGGSSMCSFASDRYAHSRQNWSRVRKTFLRERRYAPVRKSCVAATTTSPLRGVTRFWWTPRSSSDSALASSVCGR